MILSQQEMLKRLANASYRMATSQHGSERYKVAQATYNIMFNRLRRAGYSIRSLVSYAMEDQNNGS